MINFLNLTEENIKLIKKLAGIFPRQTWSRTLVEYSIILTMTKHMKQIIKYNNTISDKTNYTKCSGSASTLVLICNTSRVVILALHASMVIWDLHVSLETWFQLAQTGSTNPWCPKKTIRMGFWKLHVYRILLIYSVFILYFKIY
jgi:hypothetical protein